MYSTQRTVDECRIQTLGDKVITTKTSKLSLNTFDDKRFYVNNNRSYPQDENQYLIKKNIVNKMKKT